MATSGEGPRNVGTQIRDARKAMRWSQAELGKRMAQSIGRALPFSQASVSEFERGAEMPSDLLERLPVVFDGLPVPFALGSNEEAALDNMSIDQESWKRANNLRDEFPNLLPLRDGDLDPARGLYFARAQIGKINELLARSGPAPVLVRMSRGHGCSTLSRFVYRWVQQRAQSRQRLPIHLALDRFEERQLVAAPYQTIEDALRAGIVEGLARIEWHPLIPKKIAEPQFGEKPAKLTDKEWRDHQKEAWYAYELLQGKLERFHEICVALRRVCGRQHASHISIESLAAAWPALRLPLPQLLADLQALSLGRILFVELIIDLSARTAYSETERYDRAVGAVQIAMRSITSSLAPVTSMTTVGLSEMYFGHSQSFEPLEYQWGRSSVTVEYPWYGPHDVLGILAYHYIRPNDELAGEFSAGLEDELEKLPSNTAIAGARDQQELLVSVPYAEPNYEWIKTLSAKIGTESLTGIVSPDLPLVESARRLKNRIFRPAARRDLLERVDQASKFIASSPPGWN